MGCCEPRQNSTGISDPVVLQHDELHHGGEPADPCREDPRKWAELSGDTYLLVIVVWDIPFRESGLSLTILQAV